MEAAETEELFNNPYTLTPKHFYQPYKSTKLEAGTHVAGREIPNPINRKNERNDPYPFSL